MCGLSCEQARNLFDAYLDGDLSDGLSTELSAHRLKCPSCRHDLALLEVAGYVIRSDRDDLLPPADFTDRLMSCIEQPVPIPFYRRARVIWTAGSLVAAACLVFIVTLAMAPRPKQAVLGEVEYADPTAKTVEAQAPPALGDATADLQERFEQGAASTRRAVIELEEAGKRTILSMIDAMRPGTPDGAAPLQQPLEELLESASEEPGSPRTHGSTEDL